MPPVLRRTDFPEGFIFGTATSAYQIEGHSFGGAGKTHWDSFAATPGNVVRAENGDIACDHFHRYREDMALVADAGLDAYRFSTSWARLLPEGKGAPNPEGVDFYDRLIDTMLELGIKPAATLYHWELPQPLADIGGWRNREIPKRFGEFADLVARKFGDRLWSVAPINEPWCVAWLSHFLGHHAPGLRDIRATARAMHHVMLGHGMAISAMRAAGLGNLGAVCNFEYAHAADDSDEAKLGAARYDAIYNRFFLSGIFRKEYPDLVLEGLEPHMPEGWSDDFEVIGQPVDWLGLNYYTCKRIAPSDGPWPAVTEIEGPLPKTQVGWEIYPEGLTHFLTMAARDYTGDLPLYVTESGMANDDRMVDGKVDDSGRIAYLEAHGAAVRKAIDAGAPVKGYFIWSLMDNYEWALGYEKRFGIVHVDFKTLERTPKASWHALRDGLGISA
jgi:beta-glucosidase